MNLRKSKKPLFIIGGSGWTDRSCSKFHNFINENNIPVATSFRRQDLFDHKNENFAGSFGTSVSPKLIDSTKNSDLIIVLGARLGEMTTQGYSIISPQDISKNIMVCCLIKNEEVIINFEKTLLEENDRLILYLKNRRYISDIENLFN